ncbi:hypothetical protein [Hansschlegelia zhihuaiae]|uniref:Uncharacterized protein n=1 Tax=Hansschlegelia zhihuaiae TaxID=405005 RepID=A0A4Q0MND1_9HYPH|nr:hypothetical protein [Hansschlegelia zhihuaiae]RXF75371.1 hypothetical protein EK403_00445 [Hansschlegelia zhihuaiae]
MTNRIATLSLAAALAALPAVAFAGELVSTVDAPQGETGRTQADLVASYSPGTVGAMHYAVAGVATNGAEIQSQGGRTTAGAVRWRVEAQPGS